MTGLRDRVGAEVPSDGGASRDLAELLRAHARWRVIGDQVAIPCVFMRGGTSRGAFFRADDMPAIAVRLIESVDAEGPFGAKGLGESGVIPVAAAVRNAIKDAVGVRFNELPITPSRVRAALLAARA